MGFLPPSSCYGATFSSTISGSKENTSSSRGVDRGADPVHVGVAEGLDAGEVQDAGLLVALLGDRRACRCGSSGCRRARGRPACSKAMASRSQGLLELGEAGGLGRVLLEGVGLDHEHHGRRCRRASALSKVPRSHSRLAALRASYSCLVTDDRAVRKRGRAVVVRADDVQGGEGHAATAPAGVLRVLLALALERDLLAAQRRRRRRRRCSRTSSRRFSGSASSASGSAGGGSPSTRCRPACRRTGSWRLRTAGTPSGRRRPCRPRSRS